MEGASRPCSIEVSLGEFGLEMQSPDEKRGEQTERMLRELFRLHDLNGNGLLEEDELVQLNEKVAMLHYGKDTDREAVKTKYRALFRAKLDPQGKPVPFTTFRRYVLQVLDALDPDPIAHEMIIEQFVAEAKSARATFHCASFASNADAPFLSRISFASVADTHLHLASFGSQRQNTSFGGA